MEQFLDEDSKRAIKVFMETSLAHEANFVGKPGKPRFDREQF